MKYYTVKALSVGGRKNKIFKSGDLVNESNFPEGAAERLARDGFLVPYDEDGEPVQHQPAEEFEVEITSKGVEPETDSKPEEDNQDTDKKEEKEDDDLTKKEIIKELETLGVEFDKNKSKAELFELYQKNKK